MTSSRHTFSSSATSSICSSCFGYKAKEFTDAKTTAIGSTVSKLKVDKDKHNITVSDELQTSTKRQRKAPEGKPAGAWAAITEENQLQDPEIKTGTLAPPSFESVAYSWPRASFGL